MIQPIFNAKKLKALRIAQNLTQQSLAELADLSVRQLGAVETGKCMNPRASTVCQIASALHVPMDSLMTVPIR